MDSTFDIDPKAFIDRVLNKSLPACKGAAPISEQESRPRIGTNSASTVSDLQIRHGMFTHHPYKADKDVAPREPLNIPKQSSQGVG